VKQLTAQVDSPLSLLRHGGTFSVTANGSTATYFQSALDPVALALAPRCPRPPLPHPSPLWPCSHPLPPISAADAGRLSQAG